MHVDMNMARMRVCVAACAALMVLWPGAPLRAQPATPAQHAEMFPEMSPRAAAPEAPAAPGIASTLPADLSPWGMVLAADWVVKGVMVVLGAASVLTWTVALAKAWELAGARRALNMAAAALEDARGLADAAERIGFDSTPAAAFVRAASAEMRASDGAHDTAAVRERIASRMERLLGAEARRIAMGTGALATIGATAPFVGLFGTVWGIMNSFVGIAASRTTNLAVVAPGIAEALLATAIGLIAAIPAVVAYNVFARTIGAYRAGLGDAAAAVLRLAGRDLDRGLAASAEAAE